MRRIVTVVPLLLLGAPSLRPADFRYTEVSEVTGGSLKQLMGRLPGAGDAFKPKRRTIMYQGNLVMTREESGDSATIMNAADATITTIDYRKKEYSVISLDQMRDALKNASQSMRGGRPERDKPEVAMNIKVSVYPTGKSASYAGVGCQESVTKLETEMSAPKEGAAVTSTMTVTTCVGKVPGSEVIKEVTKKLGNRFMPMQDMMAFAMMPGVNISVEGQQRLMEEMSRMDGMALRTVVVMGGFSAAGMPQGTPPGGPPAGPGEGQPPPATSETRPGGLAGALGGLGGRLGGRFGRPKQEQPPPPPPGGAPPGAPATPGSGVVLEMTTTVESFGSAPVEAIAVPRDFKKVQHPLERMANR